MSRNRLRSPSLPLRRHLLVLVLPGFCAAAAGAEEGQTMLTGTRDQALEGAWTTRTIPYDEMPAGQCATLAAEDGIAFKHK